MRRWRPATVGVARCSLAFTLLCVLLAAATPQASAAGATGSGGSAPAPPVVHRTAPAQVKAVVPGELPQDPSAFTTVIRARDYAGQDVSVADVLSHVPGVQVRRFGGAGHLAEISIRGSTASQVVVLLDGIRINSAQSGAVDLSTIPFSILDRIEIQRGGGSVQAGSGAVGGVVNLVTRRAAAAPETRARVSGGSFGTVSGSLQATRLIAGNEVVAAYDGFHTDGNFRFRRPEIRFGGTSIVPEPDPLTRVNDESDRQAGLLRVGRDLGESLHASLSDLVSYTSRGEPGLDSGTDAVGGQQLFAHQRFVRNLAVLSLDGGAREHGLGGGLRLYHRLEWTRFQDPQPRLGPSIRTDDRNGALGARFGLHGETSLLGVRQRGSLRLSFRRDGLVSDELPTVSRRTWGAVLQDDAGIGEGRLRVIPALRMDHSNDFGTEWLPRVGVLARPLPWLTLKANLERSYRLPDFDELYLPNKGFIRGNPGLEPEKATNLDAGFEVGLQRLGPLRDVRLQAAWFRNDVHQSIVWVLVSPFTVAPLNSGSATIEGVESALSFGLTPWARVSASYTWLDARVDASGSPLPGRAPEEASLRLELGPASGAIRLTSEVRYTGRIPVSFGGATSISPRTVVDAGLSVDLAAIHFLHVPAGLHHLTLFVDGRNLGDASVRDALFFPQPGRSLLFGAEVRF